MKTVSIIIPTVNSLWIGEIIRRLKRQTYDMGQVEIIVVGLDESGILKTIENITFIDTKQRYRPAIARNLGIQAAQGQILCFLDDDCLPERTWLECLLAPYHQGYLVVGGSITFPRDDYWTVCDTVAHFADVLLETPSGTRDYLPSLNFSMHRSVFDRVGLFDEKFPLPAGEDTDLTRRIRQAGYPLYFTSEAVIYHTARRETFRRAWQRAWNFGQAVGVNPLMRSLLHPVPFFQHWAIIMVSALPRALIAAVKIFQRYPSLLKYKSSFLGVVLSKLAWQFGVAAALKTAQSQPVSK